MSSRNVTFYNYTAELLMLFIRLFRFHKTEPERKHVLCDPNILYLVGMLFFLLHSNTTNASFTSNFYLAKQHCINCSVPRTQLTQQVKFIYIISSKFKTEKKN